MNIGILVSNGDLSHFRVETLKPILEDDSFNIKLAIVDDRERKSFKQKIIKNFKRGRGGYMLVMAFQKLLSRRTTDETTMGIENYCESNGIDLIKRQNIYEKESIDIIKGYKLDVLLLVGGYGIIKEPLLTLTPNGILSYHHGDMSKYRGMPPVFWELYNGEKEVGITLQKLSVGLDSGLPIEVRSVSVDSGDTLHSLEKKVYKESEDMMYKALYKISDGTYIPKTLERLGTVYTLPNL
ncbi:hypothetical protein GSY74_05250, partial [Sulfurovum sp. bin170]|uniref:formyltransferase family protein n=1 Tax=Sulfurovum sp. bin170 TaxID=2695268 RepID=UPI001418E6D2